MENETLFIEKMKEAMKALQDACKLNPNWSGCSKCPFGEYCDAIEEAGLGTPDGGHMVIAIRNQEKETKEECV